ncbi:MAG: hypothetical protein KDI16_07655 [Halioglobus sp.]|nr:hypothetical protein [Halioglobus sp.]
MSENRPDGNAPDRDLIAALSGQPSSWRMAGRCAGNGVKKEQCTVASAWFDAYSELIGRQVAPGRSRPARLKDETGGRPHNAI